MQERCCYRLAKLRSRRGHENCRLSGFTSNAGIYGVCAAIAVVPLLFDVFFLPCPRLPRPVASAILAPPLRHCRQVCPGSDDILTRPTTAVSFKYGFFMGSPRSAFSPVLRVPDGQSATAKVRNRSSIKRCRGIVAGGSSRQAACHAECRRLAGSGTMSPMESLTYPLRPKVWPDKRSGWSTPTP